MVNTLLFAERLKTAREAKSLKQNTLARETGIAPQTISTYEGGRKIPTLENAISIAAVLDVSLDWLLGISDNGYYLNNYEDIINMIDKLTDSINSAVGIDFLDVSSAGYITRAEIEGNVLLNESCVSPLDAPADKCEKVAIRIYDNLLVEFFQKRKKMSSLLMDGTIDTDLYTTWCKAELSKLRDIKLPDMTKDN